MGAGGVAIGGLRRFFAVADHQAIIIVREDDLDFIGHLDGAKTARRFVDFANLRAVLFELHIAALSAIANTAKRAALPARDRFGFRVIHADIIAARIDVNFDLLVTVILDGKARRGLGV